MLFLLCALSGTFTVLNVSHSWGRTLGLSCVAQMQSPVFRLSFNAETQSLNPEIFAYAAMQSPDGGVSLDIYRAASVRRILPYCIQSVSENTDTFVFGF